MPPDPEEGKQETLSDPEEGTQKAPSDPEEEKREAPSDPEENAQGAPLDPEEILGAPLDSEEKQKAPSDPEEGTQGAPPDPVEETQEEPSDLEEETKDKARPIAGATDSGGPVVPVHCKLTISQNLSPNNTIAHVESTGAHRCGKSSVAMFSADYHRR